MLLIDRRSFEARSARGARDGHIFVRCADVGALRRQRRVGLVRGLERLLKRVGQRRAGQEQQRRAAEKGNSWLHASILLTRSEERRVGKGGGSTGRSRWSP